MTVFCLLHVTTEPAKAGDREGMVPKAPKMHEHGGPHRQGDHVSGLYLVRTALVADTIGCYDMAVRMVDGQTVDKVKAEPHDKTTWERIVPRFDCNNEEVAGTGRHGVAVHCYCRHQ